MLTVAYSEAGKGERIVGFYGRSYFGEQLDAVVEFGIITAPRDAELPLEIYDMPQLQNTDGGLTASKYPWLAGSLRLTS